MDRACGPAMGKLLEELGRTPLAIKRATEYRNRNRVSVAKYLAALKGDEQSLIDHLSVELQGHRRAQGYPISGHPNSIFRI
jgi:hypothetical protein